VPVGCGGSGVCAAPGLTADLQRSAKKCPPDLAEVKGAWRNLSATARAAILEVVRLDVNARRAADAGIARKAWRRVRCGRRLAGRAAL